MKLVELLRDYPCKLGSLDDPDIGLGLNLNVLSQNNTALFETPT